MAVNQEGSAFLAGMASGAFIAVLVCAVAHVSSAEAFRKQAIDHGYAEHDSKTGVWQWKAVPEKSDVLQTDDN